MYTLDPRFGNHWSNTKELAVVLKGGNRKSTSVFLVGPISETHSFLSCPQTHMLLGSIAAWSSERCTWSLLRAAGAWLTGKEMS